MSLYNFIADKLEQAGFHDGEDYLAQSDIIEYMVLEAAGALHPLQGMPLKCHFRPGHTSNIGFAVEKPRSSLEFGIKGLGFDLAAPLIDREGERRFHLILRAIEEKFSDATYDYEHQHYNSLGTLYAVILPDEEIRKAIQSSSLFAAAGDLSAHSLASLLLLKKKLSLYKIADDNLSALIDRLDAKVNAHLAERYGQAAIAQALPQVERKFAAQLAIGSEEYKFNQLFYKLNNKLKELMEKGTRVYKSYRPHNPLEEIEFINTRYDPNYVNIAPVALTLNVALANARNDFFNNPISQESFERFQTSCFDAINDAKDEFAKYRGEANWYNDLRPIFKALITCIKAIAGIIAGITVVPAVLTEIYSEQGYIGTFFNHKTSSTRELEKFEQEICSEEGLFDELRELIPAASMAI